MKQKKPLLITFTLLLPLFLLLFSYKTILFLYPVTEPQQNAIEFLDGERELVGNYSVQEVSHLEDVKEVMNGLDHVFYGLLLILTLIITYHRKDSRRLFKYGGIATISFLALLLVIHFLTFDWLFTLFHQIFFPQGNWIFPAESYLIQTFPLSFFMGISLRIFVLTLLLGILFILLSIYRKNDH